MLCVRWSLGILIYEMLTSYTPFRDINSEVKTPENILRGEVIYPWCIESKARNLLKQLITADILQRLGDGDGSSNIKNHPWFAGVKWDKIGRKKISVPYKPPIRVGVGDTSQFQRSDTESYVILSEASEYVNGHETSFEGF